MVIPHGGIVLAESEGLIEFDDIAMCAGFFQTILGHALENAGHAATPDSADESPLVRDEIERFTLEGPQIAAAIQTGGVPSGVLIVEPDSGGNEGYPDIYAYVADAELDVFRVDFSLDTITFDTEGMAYMLMDGATLDLLQDLREEAEEIWTDVNNIMLDHEDEMLDALTRASRSRIRWSISIPIMPASMCPRPWPKPLRRGWASRFATRHSLEKQPGRPDKQDTPPRIISSGVSILTQCYLRAIFGQSPTCQILTSLCASS